MRLLTWKVLVWSESNATAGGENRNYVQVKLTLSDGLTPLIAEMV